MRNLQASRETHLPLDNISPTDSGSLKQGIREDWRDWGSFGGGGVGGDMGLELAGRGQEGSGYWPKFHRFKSLADNRSRCFENMMSLYAVTVDVPNVLNLCVRNVREQYVFQGLYSEVKAAWYPVGQGPVHPGCLVACAGVRTLPRVNNPCTC